MKASRAQTHRRPNLAHRVPHPGGVVPLAGSRGAHYRKHIPKSDRSLRDRTQTLLVELLAPLRRAASRVAVMERGVAFG